MNIKEIVNKALKGYKSSSVTRLHCGTNTVYRVDGNFPIIFKEFGCQQLVPKDQERKTFQKVFKAGIGPQSLFQTDQYRIQQYIPGQMMERLEQKNWIPQLAQVIANYHRIDKHKGVPILKNQIQSWFQKFTQKKIEGKFVKGIQKEYSKVISAISQEEELVFCHNDFSYHNIIKTDTGLRLIDYQYSGFNPSAFDLAYIITQSAFQYTRKVFEFFPEEELSQKEEENLILLYARIMNLQEEMFMKQVRAMKAYVNYLGSLWAVCMYKPPQDIYLEYAEVRLDQYYRFMDN